MLKVLDSAAVTVVLGFGLTALIGLLLRLIH